jgi:UDP-3-O-[3-hydroxymyristoyl] N-acetylglucosamine deacetylase
MNQFTLRSPISLDGIGAHCGEICSVSIFPAPEDHGIIYIKSSGESVIKSPYDRKLLDSSVVIVADYKNVSDTAMCTNLSNEAGARVSVVEHLSAAFYAMGISNAIVEVCGDEIPLMDGSALQFVEKILSAGIQKQSKERRKLKISKTVKVGDDQRWASFSPSDSFEISIECDYSAKKLETKPFFYRLSDDFIKEIAPARTFGFFSDVEYLRQHKLALGASLENTVVFDNNGAAMNEKGLRYNNEPERHKILDVIGDLSLLQCELIGRYDGFCPGHGINNQLLFELFRKKNCFEEES